ncbi:endonuclease [Crossiella sp. NPDC003009]
MSAQDTVRDLLKRGGRTYAEQAGITLADKPAPLYRLLVLATLLSTRIRADIAVDAARELKVFGTPEKMLAASWQERVDALGRAHYVRYDESTATALGEGAQLLLARWHGDLRELRAEADGDTGKLTGLLTEFPRIGPVGADIFCREAQAVWPELRPYFDRKALQGAEKAGLPGDPAKLGELVSGPDQARLAAALVRAELADL